MTLPPRSTRGSPVRSRPAVTTLLVVGLGTFIAGAAAGWFLRPQAHVNIPVPVDSPNPAKVSELQSQIAALSERANSLQRLVDLYQQGRGAPSTSPAPIAQDGPSLQETLQWLKTRIDFTPADARLNSTVFVPNGCDPEIQYENGRYRVTLPLANVDLGSIEVRRRDVKEVELQGAGRSARSGTETSGVAYYFTMSTNKKASFRHTAPGESGGLDTFTMPVDTEIDGEKLVRAFRQAAQLCGAKKDVF